MTEVTRLLARIDEGDEAAAATLLPLVYHELKRLATARLREERRDHTLQATALVHEAYLRLVGGAPDGARFAGRGHFFAAAAEAMRRILIESARRKRSLKRGGDWQALPLDQVDVAAVEPEERLLALDESLRRLALQSPARADVVKLRYFGGLTIEETAQALGISTATANRHWNYARAWLRAELQSPEDEAD